MEGCGDRLVLDWNSWEDPGTVSLSLLLFRQELLLLLCCFILSRFPKKKVEKDIVDEDVEGDLTTCFGELDSGEVTKGKVGSVFKNQAPDFFQISRLSEQILQ